MDYQLLATFKYNGSGPSRTPEEISREYLRRLKGYSTIVTHLFPVLDHGEFDQISSYPLFLVQTNQINMLINEIIRNSKMITKIADPLPGVAKHSYTKRLLTSEIYYTNEIEGVKTNKKEIGTVVGELDSKKPPVRRLASAVRLYNATLTGKTYQINELKDLRRIYDELLKGEISPEKLPDGKIFRDKEVYIGNSSQKVHVPPKNEEEISERLTPLIDFMNEHDMLDITKALVTHFMFENIHPFIDGNGRTGRYLLSSYLASKMDAYTGLSISGAIHSNQSSYYKAFKEADAAENRADVTIFVKKMLEIIAQGQQQVIANLSNLSKQLRLTADQINVEFTDEIDRTIIYIFAQSKLFSESIETGIKDTALKDFLYEQDPKKFHKRELQRRIKEFEERGVLIKIKSKPIQHVISKQYLRGL